ncbi:enolase C-terminal domain-like protein, partial [Chloroflexota bacterium]
MKITDIKVHVIEPGLEYNLTLHGSHKVQIGIVRVFTDEGIEGNIDFTTPGFPCKLLAQQILGLKSRIIGEDPFYTEGIWNRLFRTTRFLMPIYAMGCIDAALWDIVGKSLSTPLYRLLGGSKDRVRAYASTRTPPDIDSFQELAESLVERGFTAIKLHPFGEADRDIELCRAIDLMIDPLGLYNREEALRAGQVVDDLNFYWYEEPLPESDVQ